MGELKRIDRRAPLAVADEAVLVRRVPGNRGTAPSKLRRDGRHCPICLVAFAKNARRTRLQRCCDACGAHPQPAKECAKCSAEAIWQSRGLAACQRCGTHGAAEVVIAKPVPRTADATLSAGPAQHAHSRPATPEEAACNTHDATP